MLAIREPREVAIRWSSITTAPCSVISESSPRPTTPRYPQRELSSFGNDYDENILQLIHAHLEVDAHHTVAYVGHMRGNLVEKMEKHFCLLTPITVLYPGGVTYKDIAENSRRLALKISQTPAEEFFASASGNLPEQKRKFDRIFINNSVQNLNDFELTFTRMRKCLEESGKIMILHRPTSITTLPYFNKAREILGSIEIPFMKIITALQKTGCDVRWDLEHVPLVLEKIKWIALLRNRFPTELEILSDNEIEDGIRELLNGTLNYLTPVMELEDRLILITGTPPDTPGSYPAVQRIVSRPQLPYSELLDLEYTLTLTNPMKRFL
ncbi:uncharacterized protein LOC120330787 [Styela clava]